MATFTKAQLLAELSAAFDSVTVSTTNLTDSEKTDCFNKALGTFQTLDPVKGVPTVKY